MSSCVDQPPVTEIKYPLISISIPTHNSSPTIETCIASIKNQSYPRFEIIVIDGNSSDGTVAIAKKLGAQVLIHNGSLLEARLLGISVSQGEYILLLDSDQILKKDSLELCIKEIDDKDMLCIGETAYERKTFVQRFLNSAKYVSQSNVGKYLNPYSGLLLPRFFRSSLIKKASLYVNKKISNLVFDRDHQILFFEAWQFSQKVGYVDNVIYHNEPDSLQVVLKKAYRWGHTAGILRSTHSYDFLLRNKFTIRVIGGGSNLSRSQLLLLIEANAISFIKGIPYGIGYLMGFVRGVIFGQN